MLLHASNNILVKKLFGNDLVGRFSYISLTRSGIRRVEVELIGYFYPDHTRFVHDHLPIKSTSTR